MSGLESIEAARAGTKNKDISNVKPVVIDILHAGPLPLLCALDGADFCLSFRSPLIDPEAGNDRLMQA